MPHLSRWAVKAAFLYLLLGFTIGALLLAHKGRPLHPALWSLLPVHIEFLLFGWVVQLTLGVAFWILPRYWQKPRRPRAWAAVLAVLALNGGIWLVVGGALGGERGALLAGRVLELTAVLLFALHALRRIVSRDGA